MDVCLAFRSIGNGVAQWLYRARKHPNPSHPARRRPPHRGAFRLHEITLTDYVVVRLLELCSGSVRVVTHTPRSEAWTGADLELWITDQHHRWLGVRVQCKAQDHDGTIPGLDYAPDGVPQWRSLIDSARSVPGCVPLYLVFAVAPPAFVSRLWPCRPCPPFFSWGAYRNGAWWVSPFVVQALSPSGPLPLSALHPVVPFPCLVCCWRAPGAVHAVSFVAWTLRWSGLLADERVAAQTVLQPPRYVTLVRDRAPDQAMNTLRAMLEERSIARLVVLDLS